MSALIERTGIVIGLHEGRTRIRLESPPACAGCGSRGTCASGAAKSQIVEVDLLQPCLPGEQVTLVLPETSIAFAALLGYLLPVIGLLLGAILGATFFAGDLAAVLSAAGGFAGGLLGVRFLSGSVIGKSMTPSVCPSNFSTGENP